MKEFSKLQIIGSSGSGKTTLARILSKKLDIPHYELDSIFWLPDWQEKLTPLFKTEVQEIISKPSWILCGGYLDRLKGETLRNAELVIWLNYPIHVFVPRLIKRTLLRTIKKQKLWGINQESLVNFWFRPSKSLLFITLKMHFKSGRRSREEKLKKYGYTGEIIELRSQKELNTWLSKL